jgi:hypothetical protein
MRPVQNNVYAKRMEELARQFGATNTASAQNYQRAVSEAQAMQKQDPNYWQNKAQENRRAIEAQSQWQANTGGPFALSKQYTAPNYKPSTMFKAQEEAKRTILKQQEEQYNKNNDVAKQAQLQPRPPAMMRSGGMLSPGSGMTMPKIPEPTLAEAPVFQAMQPQAFTQNEDFMQSFMDGLNAGLQTI